MLLAKVTGAIGKTDKHEIPPSQRSETMKPTVKPKRNAEQQAEETDKMLLALLLCFRVA